MNEKQFFIRYGIEALEYKKIFSLVKEGKHLIAKQNILPNGRIKMIEKKIEDKVNNYLQHATTEEALNKVLQAIRHNQIDLARLPKKALQYYENNHKNQLPQTHNAPIQNIVPPSENEEKITKPIRKMSPQQKTKLKQAQEQIRQKQEHKYKHKL